MKNLFNGIIKEDKINEAAKMLAAERRRREQQEVAEFLEKVSDETIEKIKNSIDWDAIFKNAGL